MTFAPAFRRTLILGDAVAALLPLAPVAAQEVTAGASEDAEIIVSAAHLLPTLFRPPPR